MSTESTKSQKPYSEAIERHPLSPFLPAGARLLMLGSFPPPRQRWSMEFFYPNLQNDMWRIMGLLFFGDERHFVHGKAFDGEGIKEFCTTRGIALSDTALTVVRLNGDASDKFLNIVEPSDVAGMLARLPGCNHVALTGQKAAETLCATLGIAPPAVGHWTDTRIVGRSIRLWRMPSSSRAYPKPVAEKAAAYAVMLRQAGILE